MNNLSKGVKSAILLAVLALYVSIFWVSMSRALPTGASVTHIATDLGPNGTPSSRSDAGGTITTISINAVQQNPGWKAYIGNITGMLVLRNAQSQSIYEWTLPGSTLSGNVFITRAISVNWSGIGCANYANITAEDSALGFVSTSSDSVNKTFNATLHKSMVVSGVGTIANNTCRSTATWINGTVQEVSNNSKFQEILLSDAVSLVYGSFIDQDSWGFDTNSTNGITHDFQVIIGDPKNATDYTYYFYADIS